MILNRIAPAIEQHLIKEQAGFRSGKSCTSQLLNLTQHIEDGHEEGMITGTAFVDLSAAYDTVNHRLLIQQLYNTTLDSQLCRVITAFHLRNREAKRSLQVSWNGVDLENTDTPKSLGVTLDRTLSYKTHKHNTKMKVQTRNNLLKKLANYRWGTNARTIRTKALALCYSTAEYAVPVWKRSAYAHLLNPELNQACPSITGCLKPTNIENLYLLAGIAPPEIRRSVCARVERTKQGRERDPLPVWAHTSKKTSKVEKKLPYKCSTSSVPSKSCPSQRMEEKTGGEGTCGRS